MISYIINFNENEFHLNSTLWNLGSLVVDLQAERAERNITMPVPASLETVTTIWCTAVHFQSRIAYMSEHYSRAQWNELL